MALFRTGIGQAALVLLLLGMQSALSATIDEIKVTALVGGVAELPCDISPGNGEVSDSSPPSVLLVVWYKDDAPVYSWDARAPATPTGSHWASPALAGRARWAARPARLALRPARPKDGGLYRCRADFRTEPSKFTHVKLIIVESPDTPKIFDEEGREIQGRAGPFREGDMPTFFCVVTGGNPPPTIRWYRDDEPVPPQGLAGAPDLVPRRGGPLRPFGLPARLPALHRSDTLRKLSCRANNSHLLPTVTATVVIDMQLAPISVEIEAREPLRAGRRELITCRARGARPPARLHWLLHGTPLPPHSYKQEESTSEDVSISQLEITVGREQRGQQLTCRATHLLLPPADSLYSIMTLDILLPPDVSLRLGRDVNIDNIKEGDAVLLECNVLAHPPPYKISWDHNGRTIAHEPTAGVEVDWGRLSLPSVQADDTGSYSCTASNVEGDTKSNIINLQVLYPPVCKVNNKESVKIPYINGKKEVELLCEVFANPPPTNFTWALNTTSGLIILPQEQYSWTDMSSKLRYLPAGISGKIVEGEALCWASNRIGRQGAPCTLRLTSPPPPAPKNCALHNLTAYDFNLLCDIGSNNGVPKSYELTVQLSSNGELLANLTTNQPIFRVGGLPGGKELRLLLYTVGTHKRSTPVELFIIMPYPSKSFKGSYTSLQTVLLFGITLGALTLFAAAIIFIKFKNKIFKQFHGDYKSSRQAATGLREEECSTVVHEDRNPDVVPLNKEPNGITQMRAEEEWEVAARSPRLAQEPSPKTETPIPEAVGTWSIRALHGREVVTSCTPLPLTQESCV